MRPVLSRDQMRAFEHAAIEAGVPALVLMENAGRGAAHLIGLLGRPRRGEAAAPTAMRGTCVRCADERALLGFTVVVVTGPGNNGGDGFVVARHLLGRAASVLVLEASTVEQMSEEGRQMRAAYLAVGGQVGSAWDDARVAALAGADVIVDALFGTGLSRAIAGEYARLIEAMNAAGAHLMALDVPSGLDAETGAVHGALVIAKHTVTFGHLKKGLLTTTGAGASGRITVSHIGVPAALPQGVRPWVQLVEAEDVASRLTRRAPAAHKGTSGRIVIVGGSPGMTGALRLAARGALRAGGGLVTIASDNDTIFELEASTLEVMTSTFSAPSPGEPEGVPGVLTGADALVVGPGLGRGPAALSRIEAALAAGRPTVLDADGLRAFSGRATELAAYSNLVLTPHVAEAAALLEISVEEIERDRFGWAAKLADVTRALVVLKGPRTVICSAKGGTYVSAFGTSALATGGTGDVLSGMIAALIVDGLRGSSEQHLTHDVLGDATLVAVGLHGLAAEDWSQNNGDRGLLASELADRVPEIRRRLMESVS